MRHEGKCGQYHENDFQQFYASHQAGFFIFVCKLTGGCRKKEKRKDKQCAGNVRELARTHTGNAHTLKGDEYYQPVSKYIVIQGAEKLGNKERRKTTLSK